VGGDGRETDAIWPKLAHRRSDGAIARHAAGQHGVIALAQLESIGLSPRAVCHRARAGRLKRIHRGVYATGTVNDEGRWLAAVLACGEGAALSHRSAAALWGLATSSGRDTYVTARGRAGRGHTGIRAHRGDDLGADEMTRHHGIPCTTVPRTLLDLGAVVDSRTLERAIDRAEILRIFDLRAIQQSLDRHRGRRGARALADALASYDQPTITRSAAEERFLALVRAASLQRPRVNSHLSLDDGTAYSPDFLWRDAKLIVEIDGRAYHARRAAFEHDRRRDRRLALAGYETRRYAASEIVKEPDRVIQEVTAFLEIARSSR